MRYDQIEALGEGLIVAAIAAVILFPFILLLWLWRLLTRD